MTGASHDKAVPTQSPLVENLGTYKSSPQGRPGPAPTKRCLPSHPRLRTRGHSRAPSKDNRGQPRQGGAYPVIPGREPRDIQELPPRMTGASPDKAVPTQPSPVENPRTSESVPQGRPGPATTKRCLPSRPWSRTRGSLRVPPKEDRGQPRQSGAYPVIPGARKWSE